MSGQQICLEKPEFLRSQSASPQIHIEKAVINDNKRGLPPKQRSLSLDHLTETAKVFLDEKNSDEFVETEAFKDGVKELKRLRCIGIIGPPGSGKTTLARRIVKKVLEYKNDIPLRAVSISKPEDWELVPSGFVKGEPKENYILIIEDIFGVNVYEESRAEYWNRHTENVNKLLERGKINVVFTCKTIIYNRNLSTLFEKKYLLYLHEEKYELSGEQRDSILAKIHPDRNSQPAPKKLRFAWCCLEGANGKTFPESYEYIWKLMERLYEHEKNLYTVLLYTLLNGGTITCTELDDHHFHSKIQKILPEWEPAVCDIKKCCARLSGTYLKLKDGAYSFILPCIRDIVLLTAYDKCPKVIDVCPLRIFIERTNFGLDTDDDFKLKNKIEILAERIIRCVEDGEHFENCEALVNDSRLEIILKHLSDIQSQRLCEVLFTMSCDISDSKCLSVILGNLKDEMAVCLGTPLPLIRVIKSETDSFEKCCLLLDTKNCHYENICNRNRHILHYVAENWCEIKASKLIEKYPTLKQLVNVGDSTENTPIHLAAMYGKTEGVLRWLISIDADVNSLNSSNKSALHLALENLNEKRVKFVEILLNHGAAVNHACDEDDMTGLSLLRCVRDFHFLPIDLLEQLIGGRENINRQNKDGWTYLHYAVEMNSLPMAEKLLELEAHVDIHENIDWLTPLSLLCRKRSDNAEMLKLLIKYKSDVNHRKIFDETPLHEAVEVGSVDRVGYLLENGANPNAVSQNKKTPLHKVIEAPKRIRLELVEMLLSYKANECLMDHRKKTLKDLAEKRDIDLYNHLSKIEREMVFDRSCEPANRIDDKGRVCSTA